MQMSRREVCLSARFNLAPARSHAAGPHHLPIFNSSRRVGSP